MKTICATAKYSDLLKVILAVVITIFAKGPIYGEQRQYPKDDKAPYILVDAVRIKELVAALEERKRIELLLGSPSKNLENGFHVYMLVPHRDIGELFPGCVSSVLIKYEMDKPVEIKVERHEDPNATFGQGMKYLGLADLIDQKAETRKLLDK